MRSLLTVLALSIVSGCTWPDWQGGGMDEVYRYSRVSDLPVFEMHEVRAEQREMVATLIDKSKQRIDSMPYELVAQMPGRVELLNKQWGRAARAFKGDLLDDALIDLTVLEEMILDTISRYKPEPSITLSSI